MSLRVVIAVTHLLGAGHLTRAAALARAFARAGHEATLASGGMPAALVGTEGFRFVQLPPVRTKGTDFRTLLDENGDPVAPARLEARRDLLLEVIEEARPNVLVTELFPFGRRSLAGEFMALIEHAKAVRPDLLVLASVRDILAKPSRAERVTETHQRLRDCYDAVLVHGDPRLLPIDASWPVDEGVRHLFHYTGYVDDGAVPESTAAERAGIVVSGGSSAASLPLYRAAIAAGALVSDRPWRILVGGGVAEADFAVLRRSVPANVTVERARGDFRRLLQGAAVSVSQAGYNTVLDALRTGVRAVLVPFEQGHETEQRLRAERLAAVGGATVVREADLSPSLLAERVGAMLPRPRPHLDGISLDGAERSVALVEELAAKRFVPSRLRPARGPASPWRILDDALTRVADDGAMISFWWRDDDAIAHTPALDRLLELRRRFDVPVAIAAIPARVQDSLVTRLRDERLVRVLVHGLAHANHAAHGERKAEFGPHRPLAGLAADAREGLQLARGRFADVLPVFVPPWNRIAPELVDILPALGFRAVSTFGRRRLRRPAAGLVRVNAHIDPVDWHGGRSLRPLGSVLEAVAEAVMDALADEVPREPIGLLTHHLGHDDAVWSFCEELLARLAAHPSCRFPSLGEMLLAHRLSPA
jgi:predicted glycosyltransferase